MSYEAFLDSKAQLQGNHGFEPVWLPDFLFDFQRSLVEWAVRKGRAAIYADCGLGKTPMELVWAENVCRKTGGNVLIDRCVQLFSNPGENVFTPFMGVGSEVYSPVILGRRGIGAELKASYYRQAVKNVQMAAAGMKDVQETADLFGADQKDAS